MTSVHKASSIYKVILGIIAASAVAISVVTWLHPSAVFPDPSWGFRVLQCMKNGSGFNMLVSPDPTNLAKNQTAFLSWWSPGQYLSPYFFQAVFGLNLAHAAVLTAIIANLCGLTGLYFFFIKARFTKNIAAISLLFIMLQEAFWIPYAYYPGGEVLLFAFMGWFLYGCMYFDKINVKTLLFILFSGWIGFFCKSSFMWIYASGLLCLWIRITHGETSFFTRIKKGAILGVPFVLSLAVIFALYLSKGENPASVSDGFKLTFQAIAYPVASPFLSGLSFDDMFDGLIGGANWFTAAEIIPLLALLAVLSLLLITEILRRLPHKDYRMMLVVFYGISILFFSYSFLRQATISYEARHLRIIGLLMTPGLIYLVGLAKVPFRVVFLLLCLPIAVKSFKYICKTPSSNELGAHAGTGFSQQFIDQTSLYQILKIDKSSKDAIFVFNTPDVSLEIQHNRVIVLTDLDSDPANVSFYAGHAGPLYMVMPAALSAKEVNTMYMYFPGYSNFQTIPLSKDYMLYTAK